MADPVLDVSIGFALALFSLGLYAVVAREGLLRILLGIEVMAQGVALTFVAGGYARGAPGLAQAIVFTVLAIEVAFTAVALALFVAVYRQTGRLDVPALRRLAG